MAFGSFLSAFVSFTQETAQLTKSIFRNPVNPIFFLNSSLSSTNWKANFVTLVSVVSCTMSTTALTIKLLKESTA